MESACSRRSGISELFQSPSSILRWKGEDVSICGTGWALGGAMALINDCRATYWTSSNRSEGSRSKVSRETQLP